MAGSGSVHAIDDFITPPNYIQFVKAARRDTAIALMLKLESGFTIWNGLFAIWNLKLRVRKIDLSIAFAAPCS
jgi:hypothetical protein